MLSIWPLIFPLQEKKEPCLGKCFFSLRVASDAAKAAVYEARTNLVAGSEDESE